MSTTSVKETVSSLMKQIKVTDYRQQSKVKFPLLPALFAIVIAWCCNCKNAVEVSDFLSAKKKYLAQIIEGLSEEESMSHDTVLRLLKMVTISELHHLLTEFANKLASNQKETRCLSLDGQTPRAMIYEAEKGEKSPKDRRQYNKLYYVTLYDSTNKISLAQDEVQDKENENKSCVRLLQMFSLSGCVVTADALNTQRSVADAIINQDGEYCLALKGNHEKLQKAVMNAFEGIDDSEVPLLEKERLLDYDCELKSYESETELEHGRVETRKIDVLPADFIKPRVLGDWKEDCECIVRATTFSHDKKYGIEKEPLVRYYLCSINPESPDLAKTLYRCIREHWHIENSLHWCLDMDFGQDLMQVKSREYARNRILLNKIALNVLKIVQPRFAKKSERCSIPRLQKKLRDDCSIAVDGLIEYLSKD